MHLKIHFYIAFQNTFLKLISKDFKGLLYAKDYVFFPCDFSLKIKHSCSAEIKNTHIAFFMGSSKKYEKKIFGLGPTIKNAIIS